MYKYKSRILLSGLLAIILITTFAFAGNLFHSSDAEQIVASYLEACMKKDAATAANYLMQLQDYQKVGAKEYAVNYERHLITNAEQLMTVIQDGEIQSYKIDKTVTTPFGWNVYVTTTEPDFAEQSIVAVRKLGGKLLIDLEKSEVISNDVETQYVQAVLPESERYG